MGSLGNDGDDKNHTDRSQPVETTVLTRQKLAAATTSGTLTLPTLPFELITEILYKLPVKFLLTLKCVCKNWNSLISDRKFAKKQIHTSIINPNIILNFSHPSPEYSHIVYPLRSFMTDLTTNGTHINYPLKFNTKNSYIHIAGSCDGMLCLIQSNSGWSPRSRDSFIHAVLWNPSIRKYKILPSPYHPRQELDKIVFEKTRYGFGYDYLTGNYKVVAVLRYTHVNSNNTVYKNQVKVHTLGTNSWRLIDDFPSVSASGSYLAWGKFVSGTINWLIPTYDSITFQPIVSLDLGTESYQEILQPDYGEGVVMVACILSVLRNSLCIICDRRGSHSSDIWLMKEYGNRDSWTKLFNSPRVNLTYFSNVLYISEDEQMLLKFYNSRKLDLAVYDSVNGSLKNLDVDKFNGLRLPEVYIESLISPCS